MLCTHFYDIKGLTGKNFVHFLKEQTINRSMGLARIDHLLICCNTDIFLALGLESCVETANSLTFSNDRRRQYHQRGSQECNKG